MLPNDFSPLNFSRSSNVGFPSNSAKQVECLSDFFEIIQQYAKGDKRWWLRGESRLYKQPCLPKFAREYISFDGAVPNKDPDKLELAVPEQQGALGQNILVSCLTQQELGIIRKFQTDAPNDEFFEKMVGNDENHPGWLIFAQHYGCATRLVDVSSDPLVALYFACQKPDNEPGMIWLYPHPISGHGPHPPISIEDAFQPAIHDKKAIALYQNGSLDEYYNSPSVEGLINTQFLFDFEAPNQRVIAQRGSFIWSGSPLWHLNRNTIGIEIPAKAKADILSSIGPFGITKKGLYLD